MEEYFFNCPYCLAKISIIIDFSINQQKYVEDCEICCQPIELNFEIEGDDISFFQARTLEE